MITKLWTLVAVVIFIVCMTQVAISVTDTESAKTDRITKLEARVDLLEEWAIRHGGKLK